MYYIYIYRYICMCMYIYIWLFQYMYTYVYIYVYVYIYIEICTYIYMYMYIWRFPPELSALQPFCILVISNYAAWFLDFLWYHADNGSRCKTLATSIV